MSKRDIREVGSNVNGNPKPREDESSYSTGELSVARSGLAQFTWAFSTIRTDCLPLELRVVIGLDVISKEELAVSTTGI